ncbi:hypothetical protein Emed_004937 [Eimeria media]
MTGGPAAAPQKRKAVDTPQDGEAQLLIQFYNQKEEPIGCQFSVPKACASCSITKSQLEQLLLQVLTAAAAGDSEALEALEGRRFSLSLSSSNSSSSSSSSSEITETLGAAFAESGAVSAEEVLRINFTPLATFRVSPLTRCSSALPGHEEAILAAAFSPDGERLATGGGDTSVRLWDLATETPLQTLRAHTNWVLCVSWASHGELLASAGMDGTVCIWDAEAGALAGAPLKGHQQAVTSLAWQPLHLVSPEEAAAAAQQTVAEAAAAAAAEAAAATEAAEAAAPASASGGEARAASAGSSGSKRKAARSAAATAAAAKTRRPAVSAAWRTRKGFVLPSLLLASGSKDGSVRIWRVGQQQALRVLSLHTKPVTQVRWSGGPEGHLFSASRDTTVKVWNPLTGALVKDLKGDPAAHAAAAAVAAAVAATTLAAAPAAVAAFAVVIANRVAAAAVADAPAAVVSAPTAGHAHWVNTLALNSDAVLRRGPFGPQGRSKPFSSFEEMREAAERNFKDFLKECGHEAILSGSDDSTLLLRKLKGGASFEDVGRMTGHQKLINCVCFSPDGFTIASGSFDKSIRLWNGSTGQYVATLRGHVGPVYQLAFSADSNLLLSGSGDSTLKVWDLRSKKLKHDLPGHADEVYAVDWSPTGTHAASGAKDRMLRVWRH